MLLFLARIGKLIAKLCQHYNKLLILHKYKTNIITSAAISSVGDIIA